MSSVQQRKTARQAPVARTALERVTADVRADEEQEALAILRTERPRAQPIPYQPLCAKGYELGDPAILWWNVPMSQDQDSAHTAGQHLATDFLKYLRSEERDSLAPQSLAFVVNGMAFNLMKALGFQWKGAAPDQIPAEVYAVIAQIGGFCGVIGRWAQAAAQERGGALDKLSQERIAASVSSLVNGGEAA